MKLERDLCVLDAGCGNGRNAVYFAGKGCKVVAADFSPTALAAADQLAAASDLRDRVQSIQLNLFEKLPFADSSFDVCVDSYVSCHFDDATYLHYWEELARVTRERGLLFTSMFSSDDEYYAGIARSHPAEFPYVTDPINGLTKRLYDEEAFQSLFRTPLSIIYFAKFQFVDRVLGTDYRRSLLVSLLQKSYPERFVT
jgi:SAM-dependent methyltransferase